MLENIFRIGQQLLSNLCGEKGFGQFKCLGNWLKWRKQSNFGSDFLPKWKEQIHLARNKKSTCAFKQAAWNELESRTRMCFTGAKDNMKRIGIGIRQRFYLKWVQMIIFSCFSFHSCSLSPRKHDGGRIDRRVTTKVNKKYRRRWQHFHTQYMNKTSVQMLTQYLKKSKAACDWIKKKKGDLKWLYVRQIHRICFLAF